MTKTIFGKTVASRGCLRTLPCIIALYALLSCSVLRSQTLRQDARRDSTIGLAEFESMALEHNPVVLQSSAMLRAAEGRTDQAGLYPNPVIGYEANRIQIQGTVNTSEQLAFIEQPVVLGGKLSRAEDVAVGGYHRMEAQAEARKQRLLNAVRIAYYELLGAQRLAALRKELAGVALSAVEISGELYNVGEADQPDTIEATIEAQQAQIEEVNAQNDLEHAWQNMAALVGDPELSRGMVKDSLEDTVPPLNKDSLLTIILAKSPEIAAAEAEAERRKAGIALAHAAWIPDIFLRAGIGYNNELYALNKPIGLEGLFGAAIPIPLFNRNQGNIETAEAELESSEQNIRWQTLLLRAQFSSVYREYLNARTAVETYRTGIVPQAQAAYDMYLKSFKQMAASYPQVLIAQRTLFNVKIAYIRHLVDFHEKVVVLQGMLLTGGTDAQLFPVMPETPDENDSHE